MSGWHNCKGQPPGLDTYFLKMGRKVMIPEGRIIEVTEEEAGPLIAHGAERVE
jgi:hypothetical protein